MAFNVTCSPGNDAAAAFMRITAEVPALVIYLDPVNMAIQLPTFPGGDKVLAKFCRELSREAAKLADEIDPVPQAEAPRHALRERPRDWFGDGEPR